MKGLLIETCTERGLVAIVKKGVVLYHKLLPFGYQNSKFLLPTIEEGLKALEIEPKHLAFIAVGVGPGSYTGIRVGAMVAKTLAFACQLPLIGIGTLETFKPDGLGTFASVIDAKVSGVYFQKGELFENGVQWQTEPQVLSLEELPLHLKGIQTLVTPNASRLQPLFKEKFQDCQLQWEEKAPDAIQMAQIAFRKFNNEEWSNEDNLELLYLRKTQAEIEKGDKDKKKRPGHTGPT